jgi:hypothetical protein
MIAMHFDFPTIAVTGLLLTALTMQVLATMRVLQR